MALLPAEYAAQRASIALILEAMRRAPATETAQHIAAAILRMETETTNSQFLMVDSDPHLFSAFTRKLLPLNHGDARWATRLRRKEDSICTVADSSLKFYRQPDETAVICSNDIVVAFLSRQRLHALAVFAHAVQVVVRIDRMEKAFLARFSFAAISATLR